MMSFCVVIAVLGIAVAASLLLPKKYTGEAAVVVDARGIDPLAQQPGAVPAQVATNYVATQVDVIASHNVALKVVDRMKLTADPALIEKFQEQTGGAGSMRDWAADELLKSLTVKPSRDSDVIFLQFSSKSAQTAADIANSFADNYIVASLELKVDPARRQAGWFDQQVTDLRAALEVAQRKLATYQAEHGVIGADDNRLDVESARLTEISNHFVAAQAAMYDAETRQRQMNDAMSRGRADEAVNVLQNPLLQNLKTELARSEAKFADVSQRYDHNHPQYMSAQAELDSLRSKVAIEVSNANGTVTREAQIARQNMADLQRSMEQQRKRILDLQHNQDELSVLKRDVESARAAYDSSLQRGGESRLTSRLNNTNTAILNYAFPPMKPSSPRLLLNIALGLVLGSLLAVGASLAAERFNRRVRSREDLLEGAGIAVLAELPRARISMRRHRRTKTLRSRGMEPRIEPA